MACLFSNLCAFCLVRRSKIVDTVAVGLHVMSCCAISETTPRSATQVETKNKTEATTSATAVCVWGVRVGESVCSLMCTHSLMLMLSFGLAHILLDRSQKHGDTLWRQTLHGAREEGEREGRKKNGERN